MRNRSQVLFLLGDEKDNLLQKILEKIPKGHLHEPNPFHLDVNFLQCNRHGQTIRSLAQRYNHDRLSGISYISILPVD
ncbi:hypothetical protein [Flavobacterium xanthum]|uniref:Uncharacterized protein n=1 Tax=Flavobacterium xanthum TaxID=69322 RepID=A0A1M7LD11_9FLAO|nr:hypothetical protein [Flavobacterium xanthum]SHM75267.1 hypothetical protein SAMN05443669_10674 [Flavobacterium xanthum]